MKRSYIDNEQLLSIVTMSFELKELWFFHMNYHVNFLNIDYQAFTYKPLHLLDTNHHIFWMSTNMFYECKQWDPFSESIFIMCANVLSIMFEKAKQERNITWIKLVRTIPPIHHLFSVDDPLVFFKADTDSYEQVKSVLNHLRNILNFTPT